MWCKCLRRLTERSRRRRNKKVRKKDFCLEQVFVFGDGDAGKDDGVSLFVWLCCRR
jgi:hypothetical protein